MMQELLPGGRFRATPLYDMMSAQPNVDAGEIRHNRPPKFPQEIVSSIIEGMRRRLCQ